MNEQDFMNMMSSQIRERSIEHPGIPTVELSTMVLMSHVAILYARLDENKWPTPLVKRIAAIDIKAAEWIVDNWDELLDEKYTSDSLYGPNRYSRDACALNEMFNFLQTGNRCYWLNISKQLGE